MGRLSGADLLIRRSIVTHPSFIIPYVRHFPSYLTLHQSIAPTSESTILPHPSQQSYSQDVDYPQVPEEDELSGSALVGRK
ncbi:hypothetical protein MJO29_000127 [Puccinia striiformis f. sp. tritici]|nr:hypothetical protein MJO29_000127 [Puccinia striiformis f. sp. tritici]